MPVLRHRFISPVKSSLSQRLTSKRIEERNYTKAVKNWEQGLDDPIEWIPKHRWIEGKPWSFESSGPNIEYGEYDVESKTLPRPYLYQFLRDNCRQKSVQKGRQSEFTENHINEGLHYLLTRPHTRLTHVFPTDEMGDAISNEKISPAINESPKIKAELKAGAVRRYAFKNGSFYTITGALKKAGGRAGSRDIICFDEVDAIGDSVFGIYEEMLSHSELKLVRKFSTPTVPGVGINAIVNKSSGYEWLVTCQNPECRHEQIMTYPDNLMNYFEVTEVSPDDFKYQQRLNKVYIGCKKCGTYINRYNEYYVKTSNWVARNPQLVGVHNGYFVTVFLIPWKTGKEVLRRAHELIDYPSQFMNEVAGLAHLKEEHRLSEQELRDCMRPWSMAYTRMPNLYNVSAGIDWGEKASHIAVMANGMEAGAPHKRGIIYVEEINDETLRSNGLQPGPENHVYRAKQICDALGAQIVVNDANSIGVDRNRYLIKFYDKQAWGCFFDTAEMGRQIRQSLLQEPVWTPNQHKVRISKLNTWKVLMADVRRGLVMLPAMDQKGLVKEYIKHLMSLGVQPRWNAEYAREFEIVVKMGVADHWADATMYADVGWQKLVGNRSQSPGVA